MEFEIKGVTTTLARAMFAAFEAGFEEITEAAEELNSDMTETEKSNLTRTVLRIAVENAQIKFDRRRSRDIVGWCLPSNPP